ncbi:MAG: DUF4349 domain-containing protein [Deltaproteobacteria bacterium]|nr:DUF4349 domain-containing protein [Deltaproteobacteria bacterium]
MRRWWWIPWLAALTALSGALGCGGASYKSADMSPSRNYGGAAPGAVAETAKEAPAEADEPMAAPMPAAPVAAGMPAGGSDRDMRMAQGPAPKKAVPPPPKPNEPSTQPTTPTQPKEVADAAPIMQMLIYTARLTMAVFEVDKSLAGVETLAREMGGFLARRSDREIVIRVPTAKFFDALKKLDGMGDTLHKDVQVEDVTEQYLDISLRLKNAREVRDRIAALLANAKTVEDSLRVERELERLSAEIERMEGRLKFLRDRAAYSTITISFQPVQVEDLQRQKVFRLPFPWLSEMGLGRLLNLN